MNAINFLIAVLAIWRLSMLLTDDNLSRGLREWAGVGMERNDGRPLNPLSWMLGCFWCCTLVLAAPLNLLWPCDNWVDVLLRPFAISGGAILVHYIARMHLIVGD